MNKMILPTLFTVAFLAQGTLGGDIYQAFLDAKPLHPKIRAPDVPLPEESSLKITHERFNGTFVPLADCSEMRTGLKLGEFGSVTTPNYPRNYPGRTSCEWIIESEPGTRIEATFFDVVTQPWFFTYFDYIMVSRDGTFEMVDRLAGDMNPKTPLTIVSEKNKMGLRFKSSTFFNYRGMKMEYLVRSVDPTISKTEPAPFDGICGLSIPLLSQVVTTFAPTFSPTESGVSSAPQENDNVPILTPGSDDDDEEFTTQGVPEHVPVEVSTEGIDGKIIGSGNEAAKNAYPWMVALLIDGRHFCGGSLIDDQHVMTAAHCTDGAKSITMLLGVHRIKGGSGPEEGRMVVNVTKGDIYQHPDYNPNTISHDITIIRMPEKVTFSERIKPICLPNRYYLDKIFLGDDVKVSGWGKTSDDASSVSPTLNNADLKVMSNSQCRSAFRSIVTGNLICVATTRQASPCQGDSGGPLVVRQTGPLGDYFMQVGIVSFGSYSCERGMPVGFTRVTAFMKFISSITGRNL